MSSPFHRRDFLRASLALGVSLLALPARACEFFSPNLRITHPWTRASTEDATFAVVCMKLDMVEKADRLIGIETPVATGAELVEAGAHSSLSLPIPLGQEMILGEEGRQIRLVGLRHPLLIARSYPLTLIFEQGGAVNCDLNVDYMGANKGFAPRFTS